MEQPELERNKQAAQPRCNLHWHEYRRSYFLFFYRDCCHSPIPEPKTNKPLLFYLLHLTKLYFYSSLTSVVANRPVHYMDIPKRCLHNVCRSILGRTQEHICIQPKENLYWQRVIPPPLCVDGCSFNCVHITGYFQDFHWRSHQLLGQSGAPGYCEAILLHSLNIH